jgi:hypothetical protein
MRLLKSLNVTEGPAAEALGKLLSYADTEESKNARKRKREKGAQSQKIYQTTKKMTSGMLYGMGEVRLGKSLAAQERDRVNGVNAAQKKTEREAMERQNAIWDKAQEIKKKAESTWSMPELKTMIQYKKHKGDSAMKKTRGSIADQWNRRKERPSPRKVLQEPSPEERREEIANTIPPHLVEVNSRGSQLLQEVKEKFNERVSDVIGKISLLETIRKKSFVIVGSWPARELAQTLKESSPGSDPPVLLANDIDVYVGVKDNVVGRPLKIHHRKTAYHSTKTTGIKEDVNTVEGENLCWQNLLENNDINATAIAINVVSHPNGSSTIDVHVSPHFWGFFFDEKKVLKAVAPDRCRTKTLVRLAYKSFQMELPFEDGDIDPTSEVIAMSHRKKIEEMGEWTNNPFQMYTVWNKESGGHYCALK